MARMRLLFAGFVLAGLLVTPSSWSGRTAPIANATGVIAAVAGSENTYTLTLTAADLPIDCMGFQAATGVTIIGVTAPPGARSTFLTSNAFGFRDLKIPPGGKAASTFKTTGPYPANGGSPATHLLRVSPDCIKDLPGDLSGPASAPPPPPPPPAKDCKCSNVTITTSPVNFTNEFSFAFDVNWTITCTGTNGTCRGEIVSHDPVRVTPAGFAFDSDVSVSKRKRTLACAGRCGRLSKGTFFITGTAKQDLKRKIRAGRKYLYKLDLFCADTGGTRTQVGTASMTVIYDSKGTVDGKASDLNGNGKPDLGKSK